MDFSKVFKVLNYIVMGLGVIVIITAIMTVAGVGVLTAGTDDITQGGATFFTFFFLLPSIIVGVVSFFAGHAGLHSDPDRCKKCSRILLGFMVLSAITALRQHTFGFFTLIELAAYSFYCYLAHTEFY